MDDSETWRNKNGVKFITILDIILAGGLIILYFYYGIVFMSGSEPFPGEFSNSYVEIFEGGFSNSSVEILEGGFSNSSVEILEGGFSNSSVEIFPGGFSNSSVEIFSGGFSNFTVAILSFVFALVAMSINVVQAFIAAKLFIALRQEERSVQDCMRKSKYWFKGCIFFLILLFVKFFILSLFQFGDSNALDYVLCIFEIFLRILGLYLVKELLDDLNAGIGRGIPRTVSVVVMSDLHEVGTELN